MGEELKLLPCPFCGGEAERGIMNSSSYGCGNPECPMPSASDHPMDREEWNRRTPGPATEKVLRGFRELLDGVLRDEDGVGLPVSWIRAFVAEQTPQTNTPPDSR